MVTNYICGKIDKTYILNTNYESKEEAERGIKLLRFNPESTKKNSIFHEEFRILERTTKHD